VRCHVVRFTAEGHGRLTLGIDAAGVWTDRPDPSWPEAELGDGVVYPGLVDGHAHLTSNEVSDMTGAPRVDGLSVRIARHASSQLAHGVLLVADKGTHDPGTVELTLDLPPEERPAVQLAGRFLAGIDGYYPHLAVEVAPGGLAGAIGAATPERATWVKLIGDWPRRGVGAVPSFTEAELAAGVAAAHAAGRRVAIHTAAPETPGRAVRAGVDSIEHGLFLTEDDLALLGERGGAWVPTVRAMELLIAALGEESSGGRLLREGLDNVNGLLPHATAAGVFVMAGTDLALGHGEVAREAKGLMAYGMAEQDVLIALTSGARAYLGEPAFAPGSCADLIVVPAADLSSLATPRLVVRCGRVVVDARV
jgi:imidazolonepropionase-like amidohydrolase